MAHYNDPLTLDDLDLELPLELSVPPLDLSRLEVTLVRVSGRWTATVAFPVDARMYSTDHRVRNAPDVLYRSLAHQFPAEALDEAGQFIGFLSVL